MALEHWRWNIPANDFMQNQDKLHIVLRYYIDRLKEDCRENGIKDSALVRSREGERCAPRLPEETLKCLADEGGLPARPLYSMMSGWLDL